MRHGWKVTFIEAKHITLSSSSRTAAGPAAVFNATDGSGHALLC